MYKDYFGLKELPFSIAPDPRYLYMSEQHRDALAHLLYGINSDGAFILLTGEVGTGKTTVCRCLIEQMPQNCDIAFILNPKVTTNELLAAVCDELRIPYPGGNTSAKVFVDAINVFLLDAHAKGRRTVVIIEEAQNLGIDVLEQVRLLTNLETNQRKLLQIIMIGQPELREMLGREELRQLSQRITARFHIGPLSEEDLPAYISHRLSVAGGRARLFPEESVRKIHALTKGIPRLINLLCDRSLLGTYAHGREEVDIPTLLKAAEEVFGNAPGNGKRNGAWKWSAAIVTVLCVAVLALGFLKREWVRGGEPLKPSALAAAASEKKGVFRQSVSPGKAGAADSGSDATAAETSAGVVFGFGSRSPDIRLADMKWELSDQGDRSGTPVHKASGKVLSGHRTKGAGAARAGRKGAR